MKPLIDPTALHPLLKRTLKAPRALTARLRLMPNFVIIGAQRCGTTSLYRYLIEHPCIAPAFRKEVHFFDKSFKKGTIWYREHFASFLYKYCVERVRGLPLLTGEATTDYIFHPRAAARLQKVIPGAKLIALLRNPVDRAYSHYYHEIRKGRETLSFEDAIKYEAQRLHGEREKLLVDEGYEISYGFQHYSYLARGLYADQLKSWMSLFPREKILIIRSEDVYADPSTTFTQVLQFLELPRWEPKEYQKYNYAGYPRLTAAKYNYPAYPSMDAATRRWLLDHFGLHNQRLYELLGCDFNWDR